jgi:alkylhydroperoxidase family enzyme
MAKRLDYNQIAPNGAKALGGIYGYVLQTAYPRNWWNSSTCACHKSTTALIGSTCIHAISRRRAFRSRSSPSFRSGAKAAIPSPTPSAALAWAETVTRAAQTGVPDEAYRATLAVFGEKGLVDLTIAISLMNAYNRMAISFRNTPKRRSKTRVWPHNQ